MKDTSKYLGCESIEERRERTLREMFAAEARYRRAQRAVEAFESEIFQRVEVEDDAIRERRAELRAARQKAYDEMREAREAVNFTHRCSSQGNAPPRYRRELDRGDWIKR